MKCQHCGAEIGDSKICEYCGSHISVEMQKEQETLNKTGCPKCKSTNISFKREKQGEKIGKKSKTIIRKTVGYCNDCGATWEPEENIKKRKTWLWVLGWIFIFPLPLTLILLRKNNINKFLKYGIIAVAWIVYLAIGFSGAGNSTEPVGTTKEPTVIELVAGTSGEYGKEITMNAGTEFEENLIVFYVPAGKYTVKNLGEYRTQVSVYEGISKNSDTGYDEYTNAGDIVLLDVNSEDKIEIPEGWFIEITEPTHISLTAN